MTDVLQLFRADLLHERTVVLAGGAETPLAAALASLGARTRPLLSDLVDEAAVEAEATALGGVEALVVDLTVPDGARPLHERADGAWVAARSVANAAWIGPQAPGGRILFVAPAPGDAEAAGLRAALENLARTLSIEWAQFGIRTTTITPGTRTQASDVAAVAAYLLSPAGEYFSGARLDLGAAS